MDIKKQSISFSQAQKMKKLGFPQDSIFVWYERTDPPTLWTMTAFEAAIDTPILGYMYAAYSVAELGVFLKKAERQMRGGKMQTHYQTIRGMLIKIAGFENEASNRAKLLIYLAENKFIKP